MRPEPYEANVAVIGGGLAGIIATVRLIQTGARVVLIDNPLPESAGRLGGFARFSGAKFSFPPAGMGLVSVAGSIDRLNQVIEKVICELGLTGRQHSESIDQSHDLGGGFTFRRYQSIVLSLQEMEAVLNRLSTEIGRRAVVVKGKATRLDYIPGRWSIHVRADSHDFLVNADTVFYAAGRLSEGLLLQAGALPTEGKGMDIGVRLEFDNKASIERLAALGPDAKIIHGRVRTFCLNSPGIVHRYPFKNITIAGGIVADASSERANIGLLLRVSNKEQRLKEILKAAEKCYPQLLSESSRTSRESDVFTPPSVLERLYGSDDVAQLAAFLKEISNLGLIDSSQPYRVHMPLLDWHWHTFSLSGSHKTSLPSVYALGDSSGHARGLLQAAVSGWLAAEELNANHC
ncbi:hypothetical protein [Denitratisoma oestradiolicum]|uniref:FAD dependent oxidoreductase n=1 Tax=Denitratisoma oestradiolicum TaxID=311182 RepID=A0A6S6XZF3_9PROT|nr:hypothetical protein [Denitratisoma oestradiolicum]TWO79274.1 hypothetical protein CBW56_15925 [Denitratisoma oestradiolicum]CAB1368282.1 conserved protein of unknown function [Denitratisoma oestradiolicum]